MAGLTLTEADAGKLVELQPSDSLMVQLHENPTTGYRWTVEENDEHLLLPQGSQFVRAAESGIGGGGTRVFAFIAAADNATTNLSLKLWREWEGDASVRQRVTVKIRLAPRTQ